MKTNESSIVIILLNKDSKIELKPRVSILTCFDYISGNEITFKFSKKSKLYNLLSGYQMFKPQYRKSRLVALNIDDKNVSIISGKELESLEKKYKKLLNDWTIIHKNSFGF